jgi:hypothetical protein
MLTTRSRGRPIAIDPGQREQVKKAAAVTKTQNDSWTLSEGLVD